MIQTLLVKPQNLNFEQALLELSDRIRIKNPVNLRIEEGLTSEQLLPLLQCINTLPQDSLNQITIAASINLILSPHFLSLLAALKGKSLRVLKLVFGSLVLDSWNSEIENRLIDFLQAANFPILIENKETKERIPFKVFQQGMIEVIQNATHSAENSYEENHSLEDMVELDGKPIRLKSLIKPNRDSQEATFNQFVQVELQHIEVIDETIEETLATEVVTESSIAYYTGNLIDYANFFTSDYHQLAMGFFKPEVIQEAFVQVKYECFANLPQAIKYLTPEAAKQMAVLLPQFLALNKENLPSGFILKKTLKEEFVLDYDETAIDDDHTANFFTPHENVPLDERQPYYVVRFDPSTLSRLIANAEIYTSLESAHFVPLMNLWVRYGDRGIQELFSKLNKLDLSHSGLTVFLYQFYLAHFDHLEIFYNETFFDALERIENFTPLQINCLKRFLKDGGFSQYELSKTLDGFEHFWQQFTLLCKEDIALMQLLDSDWYLRRGGQPVVYMERMLTILRNARNLEDQLKCLDGLLLDNYGAYYASKYEGFTGVHRGMDFEYKPEKINALPFNPAFQLYRIELQDLYDIVTKGTEAVGNDYHVLDKLFVVESVKTQLQISEFEALQAKNKVIPFIEYMTLYTEALPPSYGFFYYYDICGAHLLSINVPIPAPIFYRLTYRFVGTQLAGLPVGEFFTQFQEIRKNWVDMRVSYKERYKTITSLPWWEEEVNFSIHINLLRALLFLTSERIKGSVEYFDSRFYRKQSKLILQPTFSLLLKLSDDKQVDHIAKQLHLLKELFNRNIKFNDLEAACYLTTQDICSWHLLSKNETEGNHRASVSWWSSTQKEYPSRLHKLILANKYPTLGFLQLVGKQSKKKASVYALNTYDYFQENPAISATFSENLLLFSALLRNYKLNITRENFFTLIQSRSEEIPLSAPPVPAVYNSSLRNTELEFNINYWRWVTREEIPQLKRIRDYLQQAATGLNATNYLYYAYQLIINAEQFLPYTTVIAIFAAVSELPLVDNHINVSAVHKIFADLGIIVKIKIPEVLQYDSEEVKQCLRLLIMGLEYIKSRSLQEISDDYSQLVLSDDALPQLETNERFRLLSTKSVSELQLILKEELSTCNFAIAFLASQAVKTMLGKLKNHLIGTSFERHMYQTSQSNEGKVLVEKCTEFTLRLSDLQDQSDFDIINRAVKKAEPLAILYSAIARHACVLEQQDAFLELLAKVKFEQIDSELVYQWLDLFSKMPQRNYIPLLKEMIEGSAFIYNKEAFILLLDLIARLHAKQFSTQDLVHFCKRFNRHPSPKLEDYETLIAELIHAHNYGTEDPLLYLLLREEKLTLNQCQQISKYTYQIVENRERIADLFRAIGKQNQLDSFLQQLEGINASQRSMMLTILAKASSMRRPQDPSSDIVKIVEHLKGFSPNQLDALLELYSTSVISLACLANALESYNLQASFSEFLQAIEIAPFGKRNEKEQFSCDEVERVINTSGDLLNKTPYPYSYRKQVMEIFLLVNEIGYKLPVFKGKPAKALTNFEIKSLFLELKNNKQLTPMAKKISALALMREAMYRATGEFPYSTQMIVLIDCMLHGPKVISKVDTGQGKSLIDIMKPALLWLDCDRVELTTSSIVDAKRDINKYSAFLELLGVPYSKKPITPASQLNEFCVNGINFSTFAQLSLFFARAIASGHSFDTPGNRVSLVANESDKSILDELTIYRFASTDGAKLSKKHYWIYAAIIEYVQLNSFTRCDTSANTDIRRLRRFLSNKARILGKSATVLVQFDDDRLLNWIESAILTQYKLKENYDYVVMPVPDHAELHSAKILERDARPSPDSVFGNGMQQLLHAKLNDEKRIATKTGEDAFLIEPENRTIISLINYNLLQYYLSKNDYMWCSSGTVGSEEEIEEQYRKYGFSFSKIEPHQAKQVIENEWVILANEAEQLERLALELKARRKNTTKAPLLIFCKNIEHAKTIHQYLSNLSNASPMQLFTGLEDELTAIANAAMEGMVTVTTSAIGRNTDVAYNKQIGMDVWHTSIDPTRIHDQKSGRTGRQGSKGSISYFINAESENVHTLEEINKLRIKLDNEARIEREFNEEFYAILGHLLAQLEKIPSAAFSEMSKQEFINKKWASFSNTQEQLYREARLKNTYVREQFRRLATDTFVQMIQEAVPDYDVNQISEYVEVTYALEEKYQPYSKRVYMQDCISPMVLAHELFQHNTVASNTFNAANKQTIMHALGDLFSGINKNNFLSKNTLFFDHLIASKVDQAQLRAIYEEFLNDYLRKAAKSSFIHRWLGFSTSLAQISNNQYYLCLFQALSSIDPKKVILREETIKEAILFLIEDYLQNSWFISDAKRQAALELQQNIRSAPEIQSVIKALIQTQLAVADQDLQENTKFWRTIKPVNFFGASRLQNTISNALDLACSLGIQINETQLVTNMGQHLTTLLETSLFPTYDALQNLPRSTAKDKANTEVIATCMEKAILRNQKQVSTNCYLETTRNSIFANKQSRNNMEDNSGCNLRAY